MKDLRKKQENVGKKEISIIIPVYNAENTIERCLKSILDQTIIEDIEIIVVDDGSKDNSIKIVQEYEKKYGNTIKLIKGENAGPAFARNEGIKNAKGKYLGFVDADDYIAPNMYEKMKSEIEKDEIDLVLVGRYDVFENGRKKPMINKRCFTGMSLKENPEVLDKMSVFVWDKLYKKDIIDKYNIKFPESIHYAEDLYFLTKYKYYSNKVAIIQEALYYYITESKNSITNTCNEKWLDIIKVLEKVNDFFIEQKVFDKYKEELLNISMGYFCRRVKAFKVSNNKSIQIKFVRNCYKYFDKYFDNWKEKLQLYGQKKPKKYRTNFALMKMYIICPNFIKKIYFKFKKIYFKLKKYIKKIKSNKTFYSYCRKIYKVKENQVFFMSYFGGNITDSPYYMMKDLAQNKEYDIYVGSRQVEKDTEYLNFNNIKNVKIIKVHSKKFVKLMATAKYVINNSRIPGYVSKRDKQIFLNTWHGTPLKTLGRKMNHGLSDLGNNQTQFLMSDYLLYPNEYTRSHIMEDFCLNNLYSGKVILSGYPRNEIFFSKERAKELKEKMNLGNKKVYVYMPTWRGNTLDTTNIVKYQEELEKILKELDEKLKDTIIFIKLHQIVMKKIELAEYKNIKEVDPSYETYDFLNMADGLITDYSSVFFDFANSRKEIILFMYDYEEYMEDRGVYMDVNKLPFTKIYSTNDLIKHINSSEEFICNEEYKKFLDIYCAHDSINNSKLVNDIIFRGKTEDNSRIIDYNKNKDIAYKIILCNSLNSIEEQIEFQKILEGIDDNTILVFRQKSFNDITNDIIHQNDEKITNYVVIPNEMPMTIGYKIFIKLFRKFGIFKKKVKKIYDIELNRILHNINIASVENYSKAKYFKDIQKLYNKEQKE